MWSTISARADVKAGGQGAPLVPLYHAALARKAKKVELVRRVVMREYRRRGERHLCR